MIVPANKMRIDIGCRKERALVLLIYTKIIVTAENLRICCPPDKSYPDS